MAMAIPVVMMIGAGISAYGAIQQANATKTASQFNAAINERDATAALNQSDADARRIAFQGKLAEGSIAAGYGASGVRMEGSPLDILAQSAEQAKLDESMVRYKGALRAQGLRDTAGLNRMAGDTAEDQGYLNAASALLTGVGRAGSTYAAGQRRFASYEG